MAEPLHPASRPNSAPLAPSLSMTSWSVSAQMPVNSSRPVPPHFQH
jgi:hypothetical protein